MTANLYSLAAVDEVLLQQLGSFTKLPKIAAPFTTIVGRAQCVDPSNDHAPKFGINRVIIQSLEEVQGETGPNGARVWKAPNDSMDQFRAVGSWRFSLLASSNGPYLQADLATDYIEIVFYGTGLNLVMYFDNTARAFTVSVDGGSATAFPNAAVAQPTITRNYATNQPINILNGLTLGVHTAVITATGTNPVFYGYEVLNTTSTLQYVPGSSYTGGRKLSNTALKTDAYNTTFESGTLVAANGGHVVVYQKPDGTIKKAVTSSSGSPGYGSSASHANESVIRSYSPREFGAGRSDDFTSPTLTPTPAAAAFTLDDGTTTLTATQTQFSTIVAGGPEAAFITANSGYMIFTFVGTGLDIIEVDSAAGGSDQYTFTVDNSTSQNVPHTAGSTTPTVIKLVSGLPYGTHTVKINRGAPTTYSLGVYRFITYGPAKPAVPTGSVEITDYYLMGTYAVGTAGVGYRSTGVLGKAGARETVYTGTWAVSLDAANFTNGLSISTATSASAASYTFFGTGIELRLVLTTGVAFSQTYTLNGNALTTYSASTTLVPGTISGLAFSSAGALTGTSSGAQQDGAIVSISNLPLGLYTLKVVSNNTVSLYVDSFDIITPVHSPKSDIPGDLQSTLSIGSCALGDSRKFSAQTVKALANWAQAIGVNSSSTNSTAFVPMIDMTCVIKTSGNPLQIAFSGNGANATANSVNTFQIYVDGVAVGVPIDFQGQNAIGDDIPISLNLIVPVATGTHLVQMFYKTNAGSVGMGLGRVLNAKEIN